MSIRKITRIEFMWTVFLKFINGELTPDELVKIYHFNGVSRKFEKPWTKGEIKCVENAKTYTPNLMPEN